MRIQRPDRLHGVGYQKIVSLWTWIIAVCVLRFAPKLLPYILKLEWSEEVVMMWCKKILVSQQRVTAWAMGSELARRLD